MSRPSNHPRDLQDHHENHGRQRLSPRPIVVGKVSAELPLRYGTVELGMRLVRDVRLDGLVGLSCIMDPSCEWALIIWVFTS